MKVVVLDSRRRVSLRDVGDPAHRHYDCTTAEDGTITMVPIIRDYMAEIEESGNLPSPDASGLPWIDHK